jgi:serine/threonine-protein kinase
MNRVKQFIGEIHRRSLWQVLLIYVGGAWVCYEIIDTITDRLALPDWLPVLAIILFLIGLPVVMATAFVGEVEAPSRAPAEAEIAAVHLEARRRHRFLTWRNAAATFVIVLAAWGVVAAGWLILGERAASAGEERQLIAVLPLENLSPDPDNEFFAAGIHEDILSQLTKIQALDVISRTSVLQYAGTDKDIPTIAEELGGVDGIVEGSVRRAGNQVRVVLQLIDKTDVHLWSETYDRDLTVANMFAIQSDIAQQIARALRAEMTPEERQRIEASPTDNLEAYDFYLRGKGFYLIPGWLVEKGRSAERMFEQAVALDPSFALAHAWLSITHSKMYWYRYDHTDERLQDARASADRALELDPDLAEAHLALARYYYWGRREYDRALEALSRAEQGRSGDAFVHATKGYIYRRQGQWENAIASLMQAAALDPRNAVRFLDLGELHRFLRRYDEAESYYDLALIVEPEYWLAAESKAAISLQRDGSLGALRALLDLHPEQPLSLMWVEFLHRDYAAALAALSRVEDEIISVQDAYYPKPLYAGFIYYAAGQEGLAQAVFDSARMILEAAVSERPDDARRHRALGLAYAGLGLKEAAIQEGRTAVELLPLSKDAFYWGSGHQIALAQIYAMVGEYDAAIDQLDYLLSIPSGGWAPYGIDLSVPELRIDPTWDPLRDHPRFQALLERYE